MHNLEEEKAFRTFLSSIPNIVYVARITGSYHYMIQIAAETIRELDTIINKIVSRHAEIVKEYETSLLIEELQLDSYYRLLPED